MKAVDIVIVEDDAWLAEQYARVFEAHNYSTAISLHALKAIDMIDDLQPKVVILDVLLTGSTAFALLHELQSYEDTRQLPVILCTNLAEEVRLEDVAPYGVRRILDKTSMEPDDLITAVRSVLA